MSQESRMYPGFGQDERTTFEPYSAFDIPADLRELHGRYDVEATAKRVRNFRFAEEWQMMALGGWVATVPELPVKTGLGKVIWETAQFADWLGKRLPELRCGRRAVESPGDPANDAFSAFINELTEPESPDLTIEKLAGPFDVLKPHLVEAYEKHMRETDQIADAPTIEIFEDIVRKTRRHIAWGQEVLDALCNTEAKRQRRHQRVSKLRALLEKSGGVTGELRNTDH